MLLKKLLSINFLSFKAGHALVGYAILAGRFILRTQLRNPRSLLKNKENFPCLEVPATPIMVIGSVMGLLHCEIGLSY